MESITAQAPATVSNICCGFDILGFALNEPYDEVTAERCEQPGVNLEIQMGATLLPSDHTQNICTVVGNYFLESIGSQHGVKLQLNKGMTVGSGLGSSAASAVATAVALNALFDTPFTHDQLLEIALIGEEKISHGRHADNIAPALHGGLVLIKGTDPLDVYPIPCIVDLHCVVVTPHIKIETAESRERLKKTVALSQVIKQTSHVAGLTLGLMTGDRELISKSLHDEIIEPQRFSAIPPYRTIKSVAQEYDALGCGISGSGPSMFALCDNTIQALELSQAMETACLDKGMSCDTYISPLICNGARIIS